MSESQDTSPSGSRIVRHRPRERGFELPPMGSDHLPEIAAHIEAHIGKVDVVWHEAVSDLVHLDVHPIAPTPERDFYTLVTTGMSDRPMRVPDRAEGLRYAELVLYLPSSWPLPAGIGRMPEQFDEQYYWPIRWLKMLARLPHEYDTWLGFGHTIPNGNPPEPLGPGTKMSGLLLLPPILEREGFTPLRVSPDKAIHFWAVMPIYREEWQLKLYKGLDALLERFDREDVGLILDPRRTNVCARRFRLF